MWSISTNITSANQSDSLPVYLCSVEDWYGTTLHPMTIWQAQSFNHKASFGRMCNIQYTLYNLQDMFGDVQVPSGWVVYNATAGIVVPIGGQFGLIPPFPSYVSLYFYASNMDLPSQQNKISISGTPLLLPRYIKWQTLADLLITAQHLEHIVKRFRHTPLLTC
jgi:hypothetical protein